jgi:hypothetical protein
MSTSVGLGVTQLHQASDRRLEHLPIDPESVTAGGTAGQPGELARQEILVVEANTSDE